MFRKIDTYDELKYIVSAWLRGTTQFLAIVGPKGRGKSMTYRNHVDMTKTLVFTTRATALSIYINVHDFPNHDIIIDDVEMLAPDKRQERALLKALADTTVDSNGKIHRIVSWESTTWNLNDKAKVCYPKGRLMLLLNTVGTSVHPDVAAVLDRADAIYFDPTLDEMLAYIATYGNDGEILDYLHSKETIPSIRCYEIARAYKNDISMPENYWKKYLDDVCKIHKPNTRAEITSERSQWILQQLTKDEPLPMKMICQEYMELFGKSRAMFFLELSKAKAML